MSLQLAEAGADNSHAGRHEAGDSSMRKVGTNDTPELGALHEHAYLATFCPSSSGNMLPCAYTGCHAPAALSIGVGPFFFQASWHD